MHRRCSRGLRYRLSDEQLAQESRRLEERIREKLSYNVLVSLIPIADGGYNVGVFNRRERTDVKGLVDPSFVAFTIVSFTERSNWKSRTLQIWGSSYAEGWAISTRGSRQAVDHG